MTYTIWFEIYGKKMKAKIEADAKDIAIRKLKDKIIVHKIDEEGDPTVDYLMGLFGMKR